MRVRVLRHGNCFDGFASAAMFSAFFREKVEPKARFEHIGLRHGKPVPVDPTLFDAEVNAILDFRYSMESSLTWWFDHHRSAFISDRQRRHFEDSNNPKHHWDPTAPSCAGYIARVCEAEFGWDFGRLQGLAEWADIIDSARFPDAETAVEVKDPVLQLMSVCEHMVDGALAVKVVEGMADGKVDEIARLPEIQRLFQPIKRRQVRSLELMRQAIVVHDDVVFCDLTAHKGVVNNKFAAYYAVPDCTYVVVVQGMKDRMKLSVGSNPWRAEARRHDIARICEKFGGGGHPFVGGITLPGTTAVRAVEIGREIVQLLLADEAE